MNGISAQITYGRRGTSLGRFGRTEGVDRAARGMTRDRFAAMYHPDGRGPPPHSTQTPESKTSANPGDIMSPSDCFAHATYSLVKRCQVSVPLHGLLKPRPQ